MPIDKLDFSIIIPFKFGGKFAVSCFASIIRSFEKTSFSVIVVLDNPLDCEINLLEVAILKYKDLMEIDLLRSPGKGISDALNHGIEMSTAEYIVRHDIDDLCFSWRGARLSQLIQTKPDFIFGSVVTFPLPFYLSVPSNKEDAVSLAMIQNPFFHPASAFTRSGMARLGGYHSDFDRLEDYDLWERVLESNMKIVLDGKPHTKYRRHSLQFTRQRKGAEVDEMRELIKTRAKSISNNHNVVRPKKSLLLGLWYLLKGSL